jgi:hypothetical protein
LGTLAMNHVKGAMDDATVRTLPSPIAVIITPV